MSRRSLKKNLEEKQLRQWHKEWSAENYAKFRDFEMKAGIDARTAR